AGGMLAGAAGGGLLGAGVGSALPSWELIYAVPGADLDRPASEPSAPDADGRIGSLSLLAGGAQNLGVAENHTDFAWRLGLLADRGDRGDRFSYGVEMGRYLTGPAHRPHQPWPDRDRSSPVWHAGGVAHANLLAGPVKPYLSFGLAYYNWNDDFLGWNTGVGLRLRLGAGADWICEYRYHANLQHLTETEPQLATFLGGVAVTW
ncbi:hypothetical protein KJ554_08310, partial [bacterium]|nr:hypothetical protein [bacterium]